MSTCPSCGRNATDGDLFCRSCGHELPAATAPAKDAGGPLLVATFGPTTGWVGKSITYEDGVFTLEGVGPIRATDVLRYNEKGHLDWAYQGLDEWTLELALSTPKCWTPVDCGTREPLSDVAFLNNELGWAAGSQGTILCTTDGGRTWTPGNTGTTESILGIAFPDPVHGWAACWDGSVLKTSDSGATWTVQTKTSAWPVYDVVFVDAGTGWALCAHNTVLSTIDAGATWSRQVVDVGRHALGGMTFIDCHRGWLVGSAGLVLSTNDGGATWERRSLGDDFWFHAASFVDDLHGWIVGTVGVDTGAIVATTDGGETWQVQHVAKPGCFQDVVFTDLNSGRAVSSGHKDDKGLILATLDGGATWVSEEKVNRFGLGALALNDNLHGWAVGWDGIMLTMSTTT